MAKKPADKAGDVPEGEQIILDDALDAESLNPALAQLYAEIGGEGQERVTVYVNKVDPISGKEPRVWSGVPDDYDLNAIAKRFGSGDYVIKVYAPTERGNPGIRAKSTIAMLLDPAEDQRIAAMRRGEIPATGMPQPQQLTAADVARIAGEAAAAAIKGAMPQAAPTDPLSLMSSVVGMVKQLMPQPGNTPAPAGGMVETLALLRSAASLVKDMRGDDLPRDGEGKVDRDGVLWSKGLGLLEKIMEQKKGGTADAATTGTLADDTTDMTDEQKEQLEQMQSSLNMAVMAARSGQKPEDFAQLAYEYIPEDFIAELYNNPQWFDVIVKNAPKAVTYQPFFTSVRAALISFAQEDGWLTADGKMVQATGQPIEGAGDGTVGTQPVTGTPAKSA